MISLKYFYQFASPQKFYHTAARLLPYIISLTLILLACGLIGGLLLAPPDYQQGDGFRIIYVHVPAAIFSMGTYTFMTVCAAIAMIWRLKLYHLLVRAAAPIGACFTLLALVSGSLWGKPMWGTYWIWDARLTSELILLFLYIGYIALQNAIQDRQTADKACSILLFVGFVDIPIIHFSVNWWFTLHQGASLSLMSKPKIAPTMLYPLFIMLAAFACFFIWQLLKRTQTEILRTERHTSWLKTLTNNKI